MKGPGFTCSWSCCSRWVGYRFGDVADYRRWYYSPHFLTRPPSQSSSYRHFWIMPDFLPLQWSDRTAEPPLISLWCKPCIFFVGFPQRRRYHFIRIWDICHRSWYRLRKKKRGNQRAHSFICTSRKMVWWRRSWRQCGKSWWRLSLEWGTVLKRCLY